MLRVLIIYLVYACLLSVMLTLFVMSTQIGGWIALFTLCFLPENYLPENGAMLSFQTAYPVLATHFAWGLAAVYLYRRRYKTAGAPPETEK